MRRAPPARWACAQETRETDNLGGEAPPALASAFYAELQRQPALGIARAAEVFGSLSPSAARFVASAEEFAESLLRKSPESPESRDEIAAMHLYTMMWDSADGSPYSALNTALRLRLDVARYLPFAKLLVSGLMKQPSFEGTVWRGVNAAWGESSGELEWCAFTSCTLTVASLSNPLFLDTDKIRVLYSLRVESGRQLARFSQFPDESEVILLPHTRLTVVSALQQGPLRLVHATERPRSAAGEESCAAHADAPNVDVSPSRPAGRSAEDVEHKVSPPTPESVESVESAERAERAESAEGAEIGTTSAAALPEASLEVLRFSTAAQGNSCLRAGSQTANSRGGARVIICHSGADRAAARVAAGCYLLVRGLGLSCESWVPGDPPPAKTPPIKVVIMVMTPDIDARCAWAIAWLGKNPTGFVNILAEPSAFSSDPALEVRLKTVSVCWEPDSEENSLRTVFRACSRATRVAAVDMVTAAAEALARMYCVPTCAALERAAEQLESDYRARRAKSSLSELDGQICWLMLRSWHARVVSQLSSEVEIYPTHAEDGLFAAVKTYVSAIRPSAFSPGWTPNADGRWEELLRPPRSLASFAGALLTLDTALTPRARGDGPQRKIWRVQCVECGGEDEWARFAAPETTASPPAASSGASTAASPTGLPAESAGPSRRHRRQR